MDALQQATNPHRPPEPRTGQQGVQDHNSSGQRTLSQDAESSTGPLHGNVSVTDSSLNQTPGRNFINPYHHTSETDPKYTSDPFAGEPSTRPQFPTRGSLDDLFSDAGSDADDMVNNKLHDEDTKEPSWAKDGEPFPAEEDARPYDPNAPTQFYQDMNLQDFGSPQVSPETPFYPHQQPSLTRSQSNAPGSEVQSALSEEDQIAYFSDKAFRKALREVEPSLSKQQQYYAWRNAYQDAFEDQPYSTLDQADSKEIGVTTDRNPPYQLGMEPVGYMDGIPILPTSTSITPWMRLRTGWSRSILGNAPLMRI